MQFHGVNEYLYDIEQKFHKFQSSIEPGRLAQLVEHRGSISKVASAKPSRGKHLSRFGRMYMLYIKS